MVSELEYKAALKVISQWNKQEKEKYPCSVDKTSQEYNGYTLITNTIQESKRNFTKEQHIIIHSCNYKFGNTQILRLLSGLNKAVYDERNYIDYLISKVSSLSCLDEKIIYNLTEFYVKKIMKWGAGSDITKIFTVKEDGNKIKIKFAYHIAFYGSADIIFTKND